MNRRNFALASGASLAALVLAACSDKKPEAPAAQPAAAAAPAQKPAAKDAYDLAAQSTGFTIGQMMAANTVYVFFDPTCPHCAELWGASKPLLGKMKMVWIPIGLLRPSSGDIGGTILASADPAAAMQENEASVLAGRGNIEINKSLPADISAKVKANTDTFMKLGAEAVPLIVFKNAKNGEFGQHAGALDTAALAALTGI